MQWNNRSMVGERPTDTSSNTDVLPIIADFSPGFDSVMRGYDRAQVDAYVARLRQSSGTIAAW